MMKLKVVLVDVFGKLVEVIVEVGFVWCIVVVFDVVVCVVC